MTATKPQQETQTWSSMTALRGSGPSSFGFAPTAPVKPTKVRETLPLTSHSFAALLDALDTAGAHDLKYLKLTEYLHKTGKLLDIPMQRMPLGYSDKAECATDRVNFPVMAGIYETVASGDVNAFMTDLTALPALARDQDFHAAAETLLRSVGARNRVHDEYPGFKAAWNDFFGDQFEPGFKTLPNMVSEPDRKLLFEALSAIVTGKVTTPELRPHAATLDRAAETFRTGTVQEFSDTLYTLAAEMTELPPPEPPQDPDEDPGEGDPEDKPCNGGSGGQDPEGESGEGQQDDEQDEQDEQDSEGDQPENPGESPENGDGGSGDDSSAPEEDGEGEKPSGGDPFADLAKYLRAQSADNMPEPQAIGAADMFDAPDVDFDPSALDDLMEIEGDITVPDTAPSLQSLFLRTKVAPAAPAMYEIFRRTYTPQIREAQRLIDEFYRIKTINERGLLSGRADGARLYKAQFGTRDVFKRAHLDSVGHMDLIVLVDESGSMDASVDNSSFRLPDGQLMSKLPTETGGNLIAGDVSVGFSANRATLARLVGGILNEASRTLEGFNVEIAGYSGVSRNMLPPAMHALYDATQELRRKDVAAARKIAVEAANVSSWMPLIRLLGNKARPQALMSSDGMGDNADLPALAWAIERLEKQSRADQRVIVFIADGFVSDSQNLMPKLIERARRSNIYIHFMDMSDGDLDEDSPLAALPKDEVNDFKSMFKSLTRILTHVTSLYR